MPEFGGLGSAIFPPVLVANAAGSARQDIGLIGLSLETWAKPSLAAAHADAELTATSPFSMFLDVGMICYSTSTPGAKFHTAPLVLLCQVHELRAAHMRKRP